MLYHPSKCEATLEDPLLDLRAGGHGKKTLRKVILSGAQINAVDPQQVASRRKAIGGYESDKSIEKKYPHTFLVGLQA